jgi:hypothetical protein
VTVDLRASDADRERVVEALRRHHADGRLDTDELEERIAAAWAARYESDLERLTADLPVASAPVAATPASRAPRWPGRLDFVVAWHAPAPAPEAMRELLERVAPRLAGAGYGLVERSPHRAVFARRRTPGWVPLVVICTFPLGLLALLARAEDRITIDLQPDGARTRVSAYGTAPLAVRRAFAQLEG